MCFHFSCTTEIFPGIWVQLQADGGAGVGVEEEEETSDERGSPGCAQSYGLVPGQITWLTGWGVLKPLQTRTQCQALPWDMEVGEASLSRASFQWRQTILSWIFWGHGGPLGLPSLFRFLWGLVSLALRTQQIQGDKTLNVD